MKPLAEIIGSLWRTGQMDKVAKMRQTQQKKNGLTPQEKPKKAPCSLPRLPDGSRYDVAYDAASETWRGGLSVPQCDSFLGEAKTVFTLLAKLDRKWRVWLNAKKAGGINTEASASCRGLLSELDRATP